MPHKNNFDALRLLGALLVIYAHQYALMGLPMPLYGQVEPGSLGVVIFFSISGFLITGSWLADPNLIRFSVRRFLRIWPALAVVVLLSVFVLGPIVSTKISSEYFSDPLTWKYLRNLYFRTIYYLPGVFETNTNTSVNGPLWTIPLEMKCYVIVAAIGLIGIFRWKYSIPFITLTFLFYLNNKYNGSWGVFTKDRSFSDEYILVFLIGCSMSVFQEAWKRKIGFSFLIISAVSAALIISGKPLLALWIFASTTTLFVGTLSTKFINQAGKYGDFSYGMYIYAFPVQQTLVWYFEKTTHVYLALAATSTVTLVLAALSWHTVEKQALRLKPQRKNKPTSQEVTPSPN